MPSTAVCSLVLGQSEANVGLSTKLSRTLADIKSLSFPEACLPLQQAVCIQLDVPSNIDDRPPTNITYRKQQNPFSYFMHQGSQVQGVTSSLTVSCHDVAGFLSSTRPKNPYLDPDAHPSPPDRHRCIPGSTLA